MFGKDSVRVVTEEWEPYNYSENGELVGISTEIVKATLEKAGLEGDFRIYPWARSYHLALTTPNTIIYTIYRNQEREDKFFWIGPINLAPSHYFYKLQSRSDIDLGTIDDARGYQIGVLAEYYSHQKLKEEGFDEESLVISRTSELNIKMLIAGRVDLIPGEKNAIQQDLVEMNLPDGLIVPALQIFTTEAMAYMAVNRQSSPELVEKLMKAFEIVKGEGFLEETAEKYNCAP